MVKCLKCQRLIRKKDVPKRCPASISRRQESHVIEDGRDYGDDLPVQAPYGWTDAQWAEMTQE